MNCGQFFPQEGDIHLDIVIFDIAFIAPDLFDKAFLGNNLFGVGQQHFHDLIFFQTKLHAVFALYQVIGLPVQLEFCKVQAIHFHFAFSSGKGTDSCQQFTGGKGLGEVVVRPAVQPVNLVFHFGLGSQEHDRGRIFFLSENLHDLGAAADGKHNVQQDAVVDTGAGVFQTVVTVENGIHVVFIAFENFRQCIRQLDFVFHYKNFHGESSFQNTDFQLLL